MKRIVLTAALLLSTLALVGCSSPKWTLLMCEDMHWSGGCDNLAYAVNDISSKDECKRQGSNTIMAYGYPGYECGFNCRVDSYGLYICEDI